MISRMKIPKGIKVSAAIAFAAFALAACGGAGTPAAAPAGSDAVSRTSGGTSGETMTQDSMEKSGEAMTQDTMGKSGEAMTQDSMDKSGEAMTQDSMDKSGEAMAQDSMDKSGEAMTQDSMEKTGDTMTKDSMEKSGEAMVMPMNVLVLDFSGIKPLANGFHYEGWAIIDGSPVSTGKFNVDADGNLVALTGKVIINAEFDVGRDLGNAMAIAITIEPAGDTDSIPSGTKYLVGSVANGFVNLSVSHSAALGGDFLSASGTYILATPTDGADTNETSGIWFIDLSSGGPMPGLQLPPLPPSFEYEGWVIIDGTPVSTGKFRDVAAADSGNPFSGPEPGKPFPGEDFLRNAPDGLTFPSDIRGRTAAISIEPVTDDSPAPFALKPLVGGIAADGEAFINYQLDNQAGGFPTGSAVIK